MVDQRRSLWIVLGLFAVVSALLIWSFVYNAQNRFLAGAPPQPVDASQQEEIPPTLPPLRPTDPVRGSKDAKAVQVVMFADYTCLYCRLTELELDKALATSNDVRVVWRDLPVPGEHPEGLLSAMAGRCAAEQNRFWQMHDAMFASQKLALADLKQLARQQGMSGPAFDTCMSSGKYLSPIAEDVALAKQHHITGAPTLFIGAQGYSGLLREDEITIALERERLKAR